jgi:hypothetical protein
MDGSAVGDRYFDVLSLYSGWNILRQVGSTAIRNEVILITKKSCGDEE